MDYQFFYCIADMCFEVPEICEDYGYTQTRLPNSFGHMSTTDAWLMLESFNHLIDVKL